MLDLTAKKHNHQVIVHREDVKSNRIRWVHSKHFDKSKLLRKGHETRSKTGQIHIPHCFITYLWYCFGSMDKLQQIVVNIHLIAKARGFDEIEWIEQDKYALFGNEILVIIVDSISKHRVKKEIELTNQWSASPFHLFVVTDLVTTSTARKVSSPTTSVVSIYDPDICCLVPPHRLITTDHGMDNIPTISAFEPMSRLYGAKPGHLFEVSRPQDQYKFFRRVVY